MNTPSECPAVAVSHLPSVSTPDVPHYIDTPSSSVLPPVRPPIALRRTFRYLRRFLRRPLPSRRCSGIARRRPTERPCDKSCRTDCRNESGAIPSLSRVAHSVASRPSVGLLGSRQSPRPSLLRALSLNQGPFAPPALPGFIANTGLSATPYGPACSSRITRCGFTHPHRRGFPCCLPCPLTYMPSPLPRWELRVFRSSSPDAIGLPRI